MLNQIYGNARYKDSQIFDGYVSAGSGVSGTLSYATVEDLTIQVDPSDGQDDPVPTIYQTQEQFSEHGAFASYKGAIAALPMHINHIVTLAHANGTFSIADDYFGDLARFTFGSGGALVYSSLNGLAKIAGTVDSTVLSDVNGDSITLVADPGYVANAYRGKWLKIVSGTGAGQYKAIRSHAGVSIEVAGRFSPISTDSVVNIFAPTTILQFSTDGIKYIAGSSEQPGNALYTGPGNNVSVAFKDLMINTTHANGATLSFQYLSFGFDGTILSPIGLSIRRSRVELDNVIVIGTTGLVAGISLADDVQLRGWSGGASWLVRQFYYGIFIASGRPCWVFLYKGSIDDNVYDAVEIMGASVLNLYSSLRSSGNGGYGIRAADDAFSGATDCVAQIIVDMAETLTHGGLTGTLGDVNLNGEIISWAELSVEIDKLYIGKAGAILKGY